jgi:tRNA(Ile)-lysidine synthase
MPPSNQTYESDTPILKQVEQTIAHHAMFAQGDKVLVGVSGGPDSVALLFLLRQLAPARKLHLAIAHLNHGLRPHADQQETDYIKHLANDLGVALHLKKLRLDPCQGSLEERARDARYRFFTSMSQKHGYTKIALGHQADDDAEAVLLHLLRGSGLRGLCGIPPVRDRRIVRPLIDLRRAQILTYLDSRRIRYMIDASNADLRFDRNRIRHELLPLLQKRYNPNLVATLHRMAGLCRDEDQWLDLHLTPLLAQLETASSPPCLELDLALLRAQPLAVQRRLLRLSLRRWRGHLKRITARHVEALICLSSSGRINLPDGLAAERNANILRFTLLTNPRQFPSPPTPSFCYTLASLHALPAEITIPEADACMTFAITPPPDPNDYKGVGNHTAWFDLAQIDLPLFVRNAASGDRFAPLGTEGTRTLKKLFIDCKIPRAQRCRAPILAGAETIYWVAGLRRSSAARICETTTQALCVTLHRGPPLPAEPLK